MNNRLKDIIFGILFGAWLGLVYSYVTMAFNWLLMPGIPLSVPNGGSLAGYLSFYALVGAGMGFIVSLPASPWLGIGLSGLVASFAISISTLFGSEFSAETVFRAGFAFIYTFLPMAVILMPIGWLIRAGVNAQHPDPDRPELWARRYLIPAVIMLVVVAVGSLSIHDSDERYGFRVVNNLILEAKQASDPSQLPVPLQSVQGYLEGAKGPYGLSVSTDLENFMGPQPVGDQLEVFLVVVEFDTGLRFACVFQGHETVVPACTNF